MKSRKIKNPLSKRIPRELFGDWKKYLVVGVFLILTIGFVSGMYVANGSMMKAAEEGIEKYKREDGHFELEQKAEAKFLDSLPVKVYENFFRNEEEDNDNDGEADGTVRVYIKSTQINQACKMEGRFPETKDEIALDRMHADNAGIQVGDSITVGREKYQVVGLIAYVNYSTLHEKSTDLIFDALKFDVAMVSESGFERLNSNIHYAYAWQYPDKPSDEKEEKKFSDDFLTTLFQQTVVAEYELLDYMPAYANPAICFATDDMGSDEAMGGVLLDILIVIIAFIFAITINNTMVREASAIGTLRASGYRKGELIRHYLSMPVIVTAIAAVIGNVLGYCVFKNVVVSMYYNSYSLPVYKTIWNPEAFLKTTLIPVALMFLVNLILIIKMLQHTPLQFLRRDLKKTKRKKAIRLPSWSFFSRFRMRIILQNISNYAILFVGILLISTMLSMAVGMPDTLTFYKENAENMMFAKYQYVLKNYEEEQGTAITTKNGEAEKFVMNTLQKKSQKLDEEVSVYGVTDNSRYIKIKDLPSLAENEVYISKSFAEKYHLKRGSRITLDEKYEDKSYDFKVSGIYDKCQNIAIFMPIRQYWSVFDLQEGECNGYLSDSEITDIDEGNIATVLTKRDITKMCDQLDHSMGAYMQYFQVLCILLSAALIYLLTKLIIEKNETAISMTKILGYKNGEIAKLYLFSTTIVLIIADVVSIALGGLIMKVAWRAIMASYNGWFSFVIAPVGYMKIFAFILLGYLLVMVFDFKRIRKIPMKEALSIS